MILFRTSRRAPGEVRVAPIAQHNLPVVCDDLVEANNTTVLATSSAAVKRDPNGTRGFDALPFSNRVILRG